MRWLSKLSVTSMIAAALAMPALAHAEAAHKKPPAAHKPAMSAGAKAHRPAAKTGKMGKMAKPKPRAKAGKKP